MAFMYLSALCIFEENDWHLIWNGLLGIKRIVWIKKSEQYMNRLQDIQNYQNRVILKFTKKLFLH